MKITPEFIAVVVFLISIVVQVLTAGIFIGVHKATVKNIEKSIKDLKNDFKEDLKRLETKQDKHNGWLERIVVVEQSCKSAHHRLDDLVGVAERFMERIIKCINVGTLE